MADERAPAPDRERRGRRRGAGRRAVGVDRAVEAVRLRLIAGRPERRTRNDALIVVLTSRTGGEGVSTVAAALARCFSRNGDGRVLLVDADDRGNTLAQRLPAQAFVVDDPRRLDESQTAATVEDWGVDALALSAKDGKRFAYGPAWDRYLSELRGRYDIIVVDAASFETGIPHAWGTSASEMLLVVDTTRTTVEALERFKAILNNSPLTLSGVILNKRLFPIPQFLY